MSTSDTGKEQKNTHDGLLRIEYANNRIVVVDSNGTIVTELSAAGFQANDSTGTNKVTLDTSGLLIKDGSGVNRLLAGLDSTNTIKMKLSQTGNNVLTATDDQLIWSSDFNSFKIVRVATVVFNSMPGVGLSVTQNDTHSLGYKPVVIAAADNGTVTFPLPRADFQGDHMDIEIHVETITTSICQIKISRGATSTSSYGTPLTVKLYYVREIIV